MSKSDNIEIASRIKFVQELVIAGHYTKDIIDQVVRGYQVSDRQAYTYLKAALVEFKELREKDKENSLARHIETRWHLYKELLDANKDKKGKLRDPKVVAELRQLLHDIAKLEGLYVDKIETKSEVEHKITGMIVK